MIVRCANCHTEFSLDDHQIGPEGATVRCSVCSYVFPVDAPAGTGDHPWQIRTVEDLLFTAPDLATLRAWIGEGRLHPDDQVSRTGKHWIRLGDMPEFSSAFSGFTDLPPVFSPVDGPAGMGSALEELGPPPGFGQTMPVVQGVDTDILVVRPEKPSDFEVPVTARSAAVERAMARSGAPVPEPVSPHSETSQPIPFPLGEVGEPADEDDESALRLRPSSMRVRPDSPTSKVAAVPDVVDDDRPVKRVRRRSGKTTVRYGADEVHGASSMLDAVTHVVDQDEDKRPSESSTAVRSSAVAVERHPSRDDSDEDVRPLTVSTDGERRSYDGERSGARRSYDGERRSYDGERRSYDGERRSYDGERSGARRAYDDEPIRPRRRSSWPLVAGLGLLAGAAVVFGVPSIRDKVLGAASDLAGDPFDLASLGELAQAQKAMASLDPVALGEAEAALQGRLDEGKVPPAGVAEMKLAQVELLATRALEHALGEAVKAKPEAKAAAAAAVPSDDVERATRILAGVVAEDVIDRAHMRRVRARVRLAQGRPAAEILPLLPKDGSGELRQLVDAAPLWRDAEAPIPDGLISGLEALAERSVLAELVLGVAYLRAGDRTNAGASAQAVLGRVPQQPTALALREALGTGSPSEAVGEPESGSTGDGGDTGGSGDSGDSGATDTDGDESTTGDAQDDGTTGKADDGGKADGGKADGGKADGGSKPAAKLESVDSLIEKGCSAVENGDVSAGLDMLRKAKSRRPGDLDMLLCTGEAHAKQGRTQQALQAYESALKRSPSFASALREAAKAADKLGNKDKALRYYKKLLAQRPGDAKARAYVEANGG